MKIGCLIGRNEVGCCGWNEQGVWSGLLILGKV